MRNLLIIIILGFIVLLNTGCPKTCIKSNYSFSVYSQISPNKDSIKVGDTIYITSSFPTKLIDQNSGLEINYTGAKNLGSTLGIGKLVTSSAIPIGAVSDFNYVSIKGSVYNDRSIASPDAVQQLKYQENSTSYDLQVGLIAKSKGVYGLGLGNGLSVGRTGSINCEKASFNISINNTDQHFYIYQNNYSNHQFNDYERKHAYYFVVK